MFYRFGSGREFSLAFYFFTLAVIVFCALEPMLMGKLEEVEQLEPAEFQRFAWCGDRSCTVWG